MPALILTLQAHLSSKPRFWRSSTLTTLSQAQPFSQLPTCNLPPWFISNTFHEPNRLPPLNQHPKHLHMFNFPHSKFSSRRLGVQLIKQHQWRSTLLGWLYDLTSLRTGLQDVLCVGSKLVCYSRARAGMVPYPAYSRSCFSRRMGRGTARNDWLVALFLGIIWAIRMRLKLLQKQTRKKILDKTLPPAVGCVVLRKE